MYGAHDEQHLLRTPEYDVRPNVEHGVSQSIQVKVFPMILAPRASVGRQRIIISGCAGWKVGFVLVAPLLLPVIAKATAPNLQSAVAFGLLKHRHFLLKCVRATLAAVIISQLGCASAPSLRITGNLFVTVDVSAFSIRDAVFTQRLVREFGVAAIPVSAFYATNPNVGNLRFCFAKKRETLDIGLERLRTAACKMGL